MQSQSQKFLVTGVAGFIGSVVACRLADRGHKVVGIDNLHSGLREAIPENIEFIELGAHSPLTMSKLEDRKFDAVLHIGGQSGGQGSYDDPVYDLQANVQSTLLLLQLCQRIGCNRFIYASSVSVYGDTGNNSYLIDEDVPARPCSPYGVGKLASEQYLRIFADQFDMNCVALRLFNTYGPGQDLGNLKQGISSIYLAQALDNGHIHVKGSGKRFRDLLYIDDAVEAFLRMLEPDVQGNRVYNVATGRATQVEQLVALIGEILGKPVSVHYEGSTPGDTFGNTGSIERIRSEAGWFPKVGLEEGMARMVEWARGKNLQST